MRKIVYAGGAFYTGNTLATALLECARTATRLNRPTVIELPARTNSGALGTFAILLGPTISLISEPVDAEDMTEIIDPSALQHINETRARLLSSEAPFEPPTFD